MVVRASTFGPAVAPLWAIGAAIAIAFDQWCPGSPGTFDGQRSVTVGTVQLMSPMSSDPPLVRSPSSSGGVPISSSAVLRPWVESEGVLSLVGI